MFKLFELWSNCSDTPLFTHHFLALPLHNEVNMTTLKKERKHVENYVCVLKGTWIWQRGNDWNKLFFTTIWISLLLVNLQVTDIMWWYQAASITYCFLKDYLWGKHQTHLQEAMGNKILFIAYSFSNVPTTEQAMG